MKLLLVVMLVASVAGQKRNDPQVYSPTDLKVIRTDLEEVKLHWKAPLNNTHLVKGYLVYFGISGTEIPLFDEVENTSDIRTTVSGVFTIFSEYQFYVTAFGDMDTEESDISNIVNVSMDIPWSKEYNFTYNGQTVTPVWHQPRFLPSYYELDVCCKHVCNNYPLDPRIIDPPGFPDPEDTTVVINKLNKEGVCFINLTAVYELTTNEIVRSETLDMTTTTDVSKAPETAPMELMVVSATNTNLSITWSHLPCITTDYNLTYGNSDGYYSKLIPYTYEIGKDCISHADNGAKRAVIPPPLEDIYYTLEGLEPCTEYKLSIAAVNEVGMSDFSSTVKNMTACPPPSKHSEIFQVKFGRVQDCTLWSRERAMTLQKDLEATIVKVIEDQCNCTFEPDFSITDGSFSCYHCTGEATYRAKITDWTDTPPENSTAHEYVNHLMPWTKSGSAFFVSEKRRLFINNECHVPVFSFADPECKTKKRPPCCNR